MQRLQKVLKESTEQLQESDHLQHLKEQREDSKFWKEVDIHAYVKWKVMKEQFKEGQGKIRNEDK